MSFIDKNPFNRPTPTFNTNSNTLNTYSTAFNTTYSNSPYNNYISDSNPYSYSNSHSTNAHLPYSKSSSYQYSKAVQSSPFINGNNPFTMSTANNYNYSPSSYSNTLPQRGSYSNPFQKDSYDPYKKDSYNLHQRDSYESKKQYSYSPSVSNVSGFTDPYQESYFKIDKYEDKFRKSNFEQNFELELGKSRQNEMDIKYQSSNKQITISKLLENNPFQKPSLQSNKKTENQYYSFELSGYQDKNLFFQNQHINKEDFVNKRQEDYLKINTKLEDNKNRKQYDYTNRYSQQNGSVLIQDNFYPSSNEIMAQNNSEDKYAHLIYKPNTLSANNTQKNNYPHQIQLQPQTSKYHGSKTDKYHESTSNKYLEPKVFKDVQNQHYENYSEHGSRNTFINQIADLISQDYKSIPQSNQQKSQTQSQQYQNISNPFINSKNPFTRQSLIFQSSQKSKSKLNGKQLSVSSGNSIKFQDFIDIKTKNKQPLNNKNQTKYQQHKLFDLNSDKLFDSKKQSKKLDQKVDNQFEKWGKQSIRSDKVSQKSIKNQNKSYQYSQRDISQTDQYQMRDSRNKYQMGDSKNKYQMRDQRNKYEMKNSRDKYSNQGDKYQIKNMYKIKNKKKLEERGNKDGVSLGRQIEQDLQYFDGNYFNKDFSKKKSNKLDLAKPQSLNKFDELENRSQKNVNLRQSRDFDDRKSQKQTHNKYIKGNLNRKQIFIFEKQVFEDSQDDQSPIEQYHQNKNKLEGKNDKNYLEGKSDKNQLEGKSDKKSLKRISEVDFSQRQSDPNFSKRQSRVSQAQISPQLNNQTHIQYNKVNNVYETQINTEQKMDKKLSKYKYHYQKPQSLDNSKLSEQHQIINQSKIAPSNQLYKPSLISQLESENINQRQNNFTDFIDIDDHNDNFSEQSSFQVVSTEHHNQQITQPISPKRINLKQRVISNIKNDSVSSQKICQQIPSNKLHISQDKQNKIKRGEQEQKYEFQSLDEFEGKYKYNMKESGFNFEDDDFEQTERNLGFNDEAQNKSNDHRILVPQYGYEDNQTQQDNHHQQNRYLNKHKQNRCLDYHQQNKQSNKDCSKGLSFEHKQKCQFTSKTQQIQPQHQLKRYISSISSNNEDIHKKLSNNNQSQQEDFLPSFNLNHKSQQTISFNQKLQLSSSTQQINQANQPINQINQPINQVNQCPNIHQLSSIENKQVIGDIKLTTKTNNYTQQTLIISNPSQKTNMKKQNKQTQRRVEKMKIYDSQTQSEVQMNKLAQIQINNSSQNQYKQNPNQKPINQHKLTKIYGSQASQPEQSETQQYYKSPFYQNSQKSSILQNKSHKLTVYEKNPKTYSSSFNSLTQSQKDQHPVRDSHDFQSKFYKNNLGQKPFGDPINLSQGSSKHNAFTEKYFQQNKQNKKIKTKSVKYPMMLERQGNIYHFIQFIE